MKVDFERLQWENYPSTNTPLNADNLNRLEEGVAGLYSDVSEIQEELGEGVGEYVTDWLDEHVDPVGAAVVVDNTLTIEGAAADAKKTGDEISDLKDGLSDMDDRVTALEEGGSGGSLTEDIKQALLQIAEKVVYVDEHGQDYYDALEAALYPSADLVSISAVYTQSRTVYDTDSLDSLKSDLVVTALYDDQSTATVTAYTLSGTLETGTSTITVTYGGKTTTFNVTVSHNSALYNWDFTNSWTDSIQGVIATSVGNAEVSRDSNGLNFVNGRECVDLGILFAKNRTYELDFVDLDIQYTTAHNRLIMYGTANETGTGILLFKKDQGWALYSGSWGLYGSQVSTRESLGSSGTVKITVDSEGSCSLYLNGTLIGTPTTKIGTITDNSHVWIASNSADATGGSIYNCKVTAFRVYEGVA